MKKAQEDYDKIWLVISSCKTIDQLKVSKKVISNFNKSYPSFAHGLGIAYISKQILLENKED